MRLLLAVVFTLVGCRSAPPLPEDMEWVTASANPLQWSGPDVIRLVTPIRPPTSSDRTAHIVVALRLPAGALVTTTTDAAGEKSLAMPVGAIATRIEFSGPPDADAEPDSTWRVLDVRQFEWRGAGLDCVVLRPAMGSLAGVRWACGRDADRAAGQVLAMLVREGRLDAPADDARREQAAEHLRQLNGCVACHVKGRAEERSVGTLVQRGTDAQGLFSLRSVFADQDPVERYRPVDPNAGDALMEPTCPGSELDLDAARCRDGRQARLRLDVRRGRLEKSRHVVQVCAARLAVAARLDDAGRAALAGAIAECE
ncbi:MAG: hypothetical protein Q8S33_00545 [Myxococcales bacterium]|nr:hypothetical protein [Myxococcales bacterium]